MPEPSSTTFTTIFSSQTEQIILKPEVTAFIFDIDGVLRDVSGSYRRALADTVAHFTQDPSQLMGTTGYRPTSQDIDRLKAEGLWNNDWEASAELIRRYFAAHPEQDQPQISYVQIVDFFQRRYRGQILDDPQQWDGYITTEPLIASPGYFAALTAAGIRWGFFSGATRGSAGYVLSRLGIKDAVLVAMEDAPGKPDPTGLLAAVSQLEGNTNPVTIPIETVIYVGDTSADMLAAVAAQKADPTRQYLGVGVIPPHITSAEEMDYGAMLQSNGAAVVCQRVLMVTLDGLFS
jgi:HAD superfamily phosphatase